MNGSFHVILNSQVPKTKNKQNYRCVNHAPYQHSKNCLSRQEPLPNLALKTVCFVQIHNYWKVLSKLLTSLIKNLKLKYCQWKHCWFTTVCLKAEYNLICIMQLLNRQLKAQIRNFKCIYFPKSLQTTKSFSESKSDVHLTFLRHLWQLYQLYTDTLY